MEVGEARVKLAPRLLHGGSGLGVRFAIWR
jgi:hypothetical protein